MEEIAQGVAERLSLYGIGRDAPLRLYLRPPFDAQSRVVCPPLTRRLAREMRAVLPPALWARRITGESLVPIQGTGPGHATLMLSWAARPTSVELAWELGDFSDGAGGILGAGSNALDLATLSAAERACLAPMALINRWATATEPLPVHRAPDVFSQVIGEIPAGARYRLLGRMPWAEGAWAVVRLPSADGLDRFAERIGYATVPDLEPTPPPPPPPPNGEEPLPPPPAEIEVVSGRTTPVCAEGAPLEMTVWRMAGGYRQAVWWTPPGQNDAIPVEAGETIALSPTCALRLVRVTRKLELIAIFEALQ